MSTWKISKYRSDNPVNDFNKIKFSIGVFYKRFYCHAREISRKGGRTLIFDFGDGHLSEWFYEKILVRPRKF